MGRALCALCRNVVTSDDSSAEHIIPNAIGGRKKVVGFICRVCNSESGSKWDAELARQLNPLSLLLGIKRQSGDVPSQTFRAYNGACVRVNADGTRTFGKPKIQVTNEECKTKLHIEATTRREFRQILKGMSRTYPQLLSLDIEDLISTVKNRSYYTSDPIEIVGTFGGAASGRSLVKSAVALVFDAGIEPSQCDLAIDYLLNEGAEACFGYYYDGDKDLVTNRPLRLPFHCVYVRGRSDDSSLVGYVELYGLWRMVLCLSESYTGNDFSHTYVIDPIEGKEMALSINFDLPVSEIREAYEYRRYNREAFVDAISNLFDTVRQTDFNRARDQAIKSAVAVAFANTEAREGDVLTDDQIGQLIGDVVDGMMPFFVHNMTIRRDLADVIPSEES